MRSFIGPNSMRLAGAVALTAGLVGGVVAVTDIVYAVMYAGDPVDLRGVAIPDDVGVTFGAAPFDAPGLPAGTEFRPARIVWELSAPGSTVVEQLLARSDSIVIGISLLIGTFLLRGLLLSVADGRPFDRRNPRRLAGIALVIFVAGLLVTVLPDLAGVAALDRLGGMNADGRYTAEVSWEIGPLWLAWPVLLALAEAFRRGAELSDDVRGLV